MATSLPLRLLGVVNGEYRVFDPTSYDAPHVEAFDIISHTWNNPKPPYDCKIPGVDWPLTIDPSKIEEIKKLMGQQDVLPFMWVDFLCLNQRNADEKSAEIARMYEYYRSARKCHILVAMKEVREPQEVIDNLKFIDHVRTNMFSTSLAAEVPLTDNMKKRLVMWEKDLPWTFSLSKSLATTAGIELGVLNCYSTCIRYVKSLFNNFYFSRVWTFEELLLGKNITLWGTHQMKLSCIGKLETWMDLAVDCADKAVKLSRWIEKGRVLFTSSVDAILAKIELDIQHLVVLQRQVLGINSARTDIINGGPRWWHDNSQGIHNVFSAISIRPRTCYDKGDIFKGLLGVFNGLFTAAEISTTMEGDNIENLSFEFFKQLSIKTGSAWTRLVIAGGEREKWDWIPVVTSSQSSLTTDCYAGVVRLGRLTKSLTGLAKATAKTSLEGTPRKYVKIRLIENHSDVGDFNFIFKGCNCGKKIRSGRVFGSETIPLNDKPGYVAKDETGRALVQCATILGGLLDPASNIVDYRKRLLQNLQPHWETSDPNAKPKNWVERCVSGTFWENPQRFTGYRTHNTSMNYIMRVSCASRLDNENTSKLSCEIRVNCGCTVIAPFALTFEALAAFEGSSLGQVTAKQGRDDRIILHDGMGLVQVGDVGKAFDLVAFGGDINAYRMHSRSCRRTRIDKSATIKAEFPKGRALVREEFTHGPLDGMRDYGYVSTGDAQRQDKGSGNLLIARQHPLGRYKIVGVCIDDWIQHKKADSVVTIQ